ncbi:MAG: hypothetical protein LBI94_00905 [Treponema sp.]|jgi:hypothetical protein|nr:hypothetical protein [Treponema sp.]
MTIEQTIEIPADRWVQIPPSVPEGRARIIIEFPVAEDSMAKAKERARSALAALRGMYKDEAASTPVKAQKPNICEFLRQAPLDGVVIERDTNTVLRGTGVSI